MRPSFVTRLAVALLLLAPASCAVAPAPAPPAAATAAGTATVLTVRPIAPAVAAGADGGAWRATLLSTAGDPGAGTAPPPNAPPANTPLAEIIVRQDDGATLSFVQANAPALRAGDRVLIAHPAALAGRPTLVRLL
jgi:hypothetical protein